jgi:hypothetical protein
VIEKEMNTRQDENGMLVSFQDEFGGYSSRLRLHQSDNIHEIIEEEEQANGANEELNLCELLGIDVDKIAYELAIGNSDEGSEADKDDTKHV